MILNLDFDGVINSYKSGWTWEKNFPDPPVPGLFEALCRYHDAGLRIHVHSSRSRKDPEVIKHMISWFNRHWLKWNEENDFKRSIRHYIDGHIYLMGTRNPIKINWVTVKPPAHVTLDDRAITFNGT